MQIKKLHQYFWVTDKKMYGRRFFRDGQKPEFLRLTEDDYGRIK